MKRPASTPIDSILETSQAFNEAAERAAQVLLRLDEHLADSGIGTAVYYEGGNLDTEEGGVTYHHRLGYDRTGGDWSIAVNRWSNDEGGNVREDQVFSLRAASRTLRLHFIEHVPALLNLLQQESEKQRSLLSKRTSVLDTLDAIVGPPKPKPAF